jgi:hypothetical protein
LKLSKTSHIVTAFSRHKMESQMVTIVTVTMRYLGSHQAFSLLREKPKKLFKNLVCYHTFGYGVKMERTSRQPVSKNLVMKLKIQFCQEWQDARNPEMLPRYTARIKIGYHH